MPWWFSSVEIPAGLVPSKSRLYRREDNFRKLLQRGSDKLASVGDFTFRIRRIDNIFEAETWARLDKSFHLSKTVNFEKGREGLRGDRNAEKELKFHRVSGGRADIEASIQKFEGKHYFGLSLFYGSDFLSRACGGG